MFLGRFRRRLRLRNSAATSRGRITKASANLSDETVSRAEQKRGSTFAYLRNGACANFHALQCVPLLEDCLAPAQSVAWSEHVPAFSKLLAARITIRRTYLTGASKWHQIVCIGDIRLCGGRKRANFSQSFAQLAMLQREREANAGEFARVGQHMAGEWAKLTAKQDAGPLPLMSLVSPTTVRFASLHASWPVERPPDCLILLVCDAYTLAQGRTLAH